MNTFKMFFSIMLLIIGSMLIFNIVTAEPIELNEGQETENMISLDVKNINLEDVLRLIADQSGLNIVTSKNVRGNITVKLKNVPVEDALGAILEVNNCKYVKEGNIIRVYTYQDLQQEERFEDLETKVYSLEFAKAADLKPLLLTIKSTRGKIEVNAKANQIIISDIPNVLKQVGDIVEELDKETSLKIFELSYADPDEIQTKLTQLIPKTEGEIMVDARTNSVIVKAPLSIQEEVEVMIKKWDRQNKQVQIEAKILEVTLDDSVSLGVKWEYVTPTTFKRHEPSTYDLLNDFSVSLADGGIFKVGTLSADDYESTLEMLATQTNADVLSSPKVTVLDGQEASILVGSSEPYMVTSEDPVTGFVTETTNFIDVGIKLVVAPKIGQDDYITMAIHPEVSSARRVAEVDNALAVDTTEADTKLTVKNGETVVLGGLMKQESEKTVKKIPILGDIPVLGLAFRSRVEQNVKKELIVFITPYILSAEGKVVKDTEEQKIERLIRETICEINKRRKYKEDISLEQD